MRRHPELRDISREHHGALKMARDARHAAESGQMGEIQRQAERIVAAFAAQLEPHFRAEEQGMLPLLSRGGRHDLVRRTLAEHGEIRALAAGLKWPDARTLRRFADLMEVHVRFEERELFETVQTLMNSAGPIGNHDV
jgi:hemerythrin-like domain-containing protein